MFTNRRSDLVTSTSRVNNKVSKALTFVFHLYEDFKWTWHYPRVVPSVLIFRSSYFDIKSNHNFGSLQYPRETKYILGPPMAHGTVESDDHLTMRDMYRNILIFLQDSEF